MPLRKEDKSWMPILKSNERAVMCKLDIEKVYDHVDWSFLLSVMSMMGFGEKWLRWMQ